MAKLPKIMLIGIIIINLLTPFVTVSAEGQVSTPPLEHHAKSTSKDSDRKRSSETNTKEIKRQNSLNLEVDKVECKIKPNT
ncbi:hypothetical protein BMS86_04295 [Leuconostoc pseudomesenteroides]|nr:hypothetical protein BMS86_04295 [Leuconostoc pseudomesenteroides]